MNLIYEVSVIFERERERGVKGEMGGQLGFAVVLSPDTGVASVTLVEGRNCGRYDLFKGPGRYKMLSIDSDCQPH